MMYGTDGTDGMVILGQRSSNKNKTAESNFLHKQITSVPIFQFLTLFKRAGGEWVKPMLQHKTDMKRILRVKVSRF